MIPRIKLFILLFYISTLAAAQKYPVQINARLIPPFSGYLPEYGLPGSEKFKVVLLLTDFNKGQYPVKLQFKLEGNGISIITKPNYNPAGIILDAGVPLELSSEQLNSYFTADHLDFSGLDPDTYEKTQTLPEGHYTLCVTAYAYNSPSPVQVSNNACAMAWLMQSDPPRLNTPICGSSIKITTPQQIIFKWLNMNAGSPNGAGTEYELSLYEIRPRERNPNDVIATVKPILQTTTDFTTYIYGLSDTPLIPGMEYVWRVQAKDKAGKASIKNNGYSEACTFTYGSKYDEVSLTLNSKALNYTQAQLSWDSASPFKPFTLNYRKKGTEFWFTATTDSTLYKLSNLEQATSYEARVQGQAADYTSQWSNTSTFQTQENAAIACSSTLPLTPTNNTKPLPAASPGMVFKVGNFELLVTSITGSNGTFTGYGKIKVPFLGIGLNAKYDNIFVNDEKTVTTGEVKIVSDKIDDWVNDNTIGTVHSGQETTDHVINFPTNTSNIQVNGNTVIIKGNDGQSTTIPYIPGTETTIKDSSGNLFVIDKNGKVEQIGKSGKGTGPIANNLNYLNTRYATAEFTANPNQQNGFDAFTYEKLKRYYEQLRDTNKNSNVAISWKSTPASKTDVVDVSISTKGKRVNPDSIIFITGTGTQYYATGTGNKKTLRVLGGAHGDVQELFAAYRDKGELVFVGKLNVVSYKANSKKVVLVPFNNNGTPSAQDIQNALNQIYAQAITSFDVSVAAPLTVDKTIWDKDNNGRLNAGKELFNRYSGEMVAVNNLLKQQSYYDKNSYYIILTGLQADSLNDDIQGEMPRGRNIGYLFSTNGGSKEQQTRLIAHELGHGAFALEHTFEGNTPIDKGTTNNLMDYANEKHLHKYQWSYVQQPVNIIGILESEEDAASKSIRYSINKDDSKKEINKEDNSVVYIGLTPNGKIITELVNATAGEVSIAAISEALPYVVARINVFNANRQLLRSYKWQNDAYVDAGGKSCTNLVMGSTKGKVKVYLTATKECRYQYQIIEWDPNTDTQTNISKKIVAAKWKLNTFFNPDPSCVKAYVDELDTRDNSPQCADVAEIERGKNELLKFVNATSADDEKLVITILASCKSSIIKLGYSNIETLFARLATSKEIKNKKELALLRLLSSINTKDYSKFYTLLAKNKNELLRNLVLGMDDTILYVFGNNNYTNFIGALCWMFQFDNRVAELPVAKEANTLGRIINFKPYKFKEPSWTTTGNMRLNFSYDAETGQVTVFQEEGVMVNAGGTVGEGWQRIEGNFPALNPLAPVVLVADNDELPLVRTALESTTEYAGKYYVVPAIFLKYRSDKIRNDAIETAALITLDAVTIFASGGVALAAEVAWARRLWAITEVAGAVGNIAVNSGIIKEDDKLYKAVEIYNATMMLVGIKNAVAGAPKVAKGVYGFAISLPEKTKALLQQNSNIKALLLASYINWRTAITDLEVITAAEKQLVNEGRIAEVKSIAPDKLKELVDEEKAWKAWGVVEGGGSNLISSFSRETISKINGFVDNIPSLVSKQGITLDEFKVLQQKAYDNLTLLEQSVVNNMRNSIPSLDANTILQKVIPKADLPKYLNGDYKQIGGFISTAKDAKHLTTYEDIYHGMRLDYGGTKFSLSDGSCGVIKYKTPNANSVIVPSVSKGFTEVIDPPFTGHGFTSGNDGRLGVPEWKSGYLTPDEGSELWEVYSDGSEMLRAKFSSAQNKFIPVQ